jgi:ribosomal protein L31E
VSDGISELSWQDIIVTTFAKLQALPKAVLIRAFLRLREKYFKAIQRQEQAEAERKKAEIEIRKLKKALLIATGKGDDDPSPTTPSGQIPPYKKGNNGKKRRRKNGQKKGHKGTTRGCAEEVTDTFDAVPEGRCACGCEEFGEPFPVSSRTVEDIEEVKLKKTKVTVYGKKCKKCHKIVRAFVEDVMKGNQIGNGILIWSLWLHLFIGVSIRKVEMICNKLLGFRISGGCLVQNWHRIADILEPAYKKLLPYLERGGHANVDETGWRMRGTTWWAWVFTNNLVCVYVIANSRASAIAREILGDSFKGTLISDFFSAYNLIEAVAKQKCYSHLFTEMKKCLKTDDSESLKRFCKVLKRLLRDAMRLHHVYMNGEIAEKEYKRRREQIEKRLSNLCRTPIGTQNSNVKRLRKRLKKHRNELLTFLYRLGVEPTNNKAERRIRIFALQRKVSFGSFSERGVKTRFILTSLIQTCHMLDVSFTAFAAFNLNEHLQGREVLGVHEYKKLIEARNTMSRAA